MKCLYKKVGRKWREVCVEQIFAQPPSRPSLSSTKNEAPRASFSFRKAPCAPRAQAFAPSIDIQFPNHFPFKPKDFRLDLTKLHTPQNHAYSSLNSTNFPRVSPFFLFIRVSFFTTNSDFTTLCFKSKFSYKISMPRHKVDINLKHRSVTNQSNSSQKIL